MPGHKIRRLTSPDVLRQIEADRLLQLLARFSSYFEEAGLPLPAAGADILIERLAVLLADAQKDAPPGQVSFFLTSDALPARPLSSNWQPDPRRSCHIYPDPV